MDIKDKELRRYHIQDLTKCFFTNSFRIINTASFKYINIIYLLWQKCKVYMNTFPKLTVLIMQT